MCAHVQRFTQLVATCVVLNSSFFSLRHWSISTLWRRDVIGRDTTHEFCIARPELTRP